MKIDDPMVILLSNQLAIMQALAILLTDKVAVETRGQGAHDLLGRIHRTQTLITAMMTEAGGPAPRGTPPP